MPFSSEDKWRIMRHLKAEYSQEQQIDALLLAVQNRSESLVQECQRILQELEEAREQLAEAAQGLIRADVLEWKSDRQCGLANHKESLRRELARIIGYSLISSFPW